MGGCGVIEAMKRSRAPLLLTFLALFALAVRPALGAMEITVSVSPAEGVVGRPVEVLVRTFVPFGRDAIDLPVPSVPYPAPSGFWNVLYPVADYPFDVAAAAEDGTTVAVFISRDPADATLWRGTFTPPKDGMWTINLRQFGASARLRVAPGDAIPLAALVGVPALVGGVLAGLAVGRSRPISGRRP
jgi:hypothetical protein